MTIKELSEKLNISSSTISRVLNDKPGISEKTREKVFKAIKEEGFAPNYMARNLATAKAQFIGVVARRRNDEQDQLFFSHTLSKFQDIFVDNGFIVVPLYYTNSEIDFSKVPLSPQDFAGFIVRGQSIPQKTILSIQKFGVPFVLLENNLSQTLVDCVICNDFELEYDLTKLLIEKNCKRVIHVTGPKHWHNNNERLKGYLKAVTEANIESEIYYADDTTVKCGKQISEQIKIRKNEKTGIAFVNDAMAIGYLYANRNSTFKIPENVCLTGFDDIPWAKLSHPSLTTAQIAVGQMGRLAANRLIDLINEQKDAENNPIKMVVSGKITVRESC